MFRRSVLDIFVDVYNSTIHTHWQRRKMSAHVFHTRMFILLSMCSLVAAKEGKHQEKCPCDISASKLLADCSSKNLTNVPDCVPNNTRHFVLKNNQLVYSPGQFQRFRNLEELDLFHNEAFAAHSDSFRGLYQLQYLNLDGTNFTYLTEDTFADLHNLSYLVMGGYPRQLNINQAFFASLKNLTTLILSRIWQLEIENCSFSKLSKLENLDLSIVTRLNLSTNAFEGMTALKWLSMANPIYTLSLPVDIFKPLIHLEVIHLQGLCTVLKPAFNCETIDERLKYAPSLKKVYIDNILINHLGTGFQSLKHLEDLHLTPGVPPRCCEIARLDGSYFKYLNALSLTKLFLDNCYIQLIMPNSFRSLSQLSTLKLNIDSTSPFLQFFAIGLQATNIENITLSISNILYSKVLPVIEGLNETKLKSFDLSMTALDTVPGDAIKSLPKSLSHFSLSNNGIKFIDVADLTYLENLETLDLSNQADDPAMLVERLIGPEQFSETEIGPLILREGQNDCLSLPYKLKSVNVCNSSLLCVMTPLFCGSNNSLRTLDASEQRDRSCITSNKFWTSLKNLVKLEDLKLDWNLISDIPRNAFSRQTELRTLSLKGNKLIKLSFQIGAMKYLQTLDLSSNSIRYASTSFTKDAKDIAESSKFILDLSNNPLVCYCVHQDFVAWLRNTDVILEKNNLNCIFENGTKISLSQIAEIHELLDVECIMTKITVACAMTFFILNFLFGGIAYSSHIRQKLGYLLSYGRHTLNPYHPIEYCDIEMEYDVYISFEGDSHVTPHETLRDFVLYKLLPGLERREFKVGIRERFEPGRNLYEMISSAVRRSKKVLVLLTKDYCKDMWNVFEFNQAVMEGIYTNRQIAIPILFESLRRDTVSEEVFAFLRMEPVARYSHDVSDRAFIDYVCEKIRDTTRKFN